MRTVELHQAFAWTCEDCGKDNFARAVTLSPEQAEAMVVKDGSGERVDPAGMEGVWTTVPDEVKCVHCGSEFETEVP